MAIYASKSKQAFFDDEVFGPKRITVIDPNWSVPKVVVGDVEIDDTSATPEFIEIDNPECRLPVDAVELTRDLRDELLAAQGNGKVIDWSGEVPAAVDAPPPSISVVKARIDAWIERFLNDFAAAWGYSQGIGVAVTWVGSGNTRFRDEAMALSQYRDEVWVWVEQYCAQIESGGVEAPASEEELVALLPPAPQRPA